MSEQNNEKRKKRIKGIGGIINNMMKPLEVDDIFLSKFSKLKMKALINAFDTRYAALISFNEGSIEVEGLKNKPEEAISKKKLNWNGKLETDVTTLLKIATGEMGIGGLIKNIITRKIKLKGILKMLSLYNIFQIANAKQEKPKKEETLKEKKKRAKKDSSALFSRRSKFITAGIVGIALPLILTILFMLALGTYSSLWELSKGDLGLFFSMVLFNSLSYLNDIFLLGKGYWYVFIIWALTGLLIGLLTRDFLKSLIIDAFAIFVYMILYTIFVGMNSANFPAIFIDTLITESSYLYPGLIEGPLIFFNLLVQITVESFVIPMMVLFTLIGGIINPKPEYYTVFDATPAKKIKKKYKGSVVSTKKLGSIEQKKERTYLEEQTHIREI
jgi:hypothetical protein